MDILVTIRPVAYIVATSSMPSLSNTQLPLSVTVTIMALHKQQSMLTTARVRLSLNIHGGDFVVRRDVVYAALVMRKVRR